ncbi:MAG: hypothetical protein KDA62_15650, partial [Planctomycetales bacterium]|nr:hypothetical protein [Planctomycetales bacterium]
MRGFKPSRREGLGLGGGAKHSRRIKRRESRRMFLESLEPRHLLAGDWTNAANPLDVNADRFVSPIDVLLLVNRAQERKTGPLPHESDPTETPPPYVDVNCDGEFSPIDVLLIINALNLDTEPPALSLALANDTGLAGFQNDRITSNAIVAGQVTDQLGVLSLTAQVDDGEPVEVEFDDFGNFTFDPGLANDGSADGEQTLRFVAFDPRQHVTTLDFTFTLDTTPPASPQFDLAIESDSGEVGDGATELDVVTLAGVTESEAFVADAASGIQVQADEAGEFAIPGVLLDFGANSVTLVATDIAGNQSQGSATAELTSPAGSLLLAEQSEFAVEASQVVELGGENGRRTIRFDVLSRFDLTDSEALVEDTLLVSLVDVNDGSQTLLGRGGEAGTALFALVGGEAEYQPGLVRFDGHTVSIDASSLSFQNEGRLLFQLLNLDGDTGTRVAIANIASTFEEGEPPSPAFPMPVDLVSVGGAMNVGSLNATSDVAIETHNARLDSATGRYTAELRLKNLGKAVGRMAAVVLRDLPAGVTLVNASGVDANGDPYLNLSTAIRSGGLGANAVSQTVLLELQNPGAEQFRLVAEVLFGGPNTAPEFVAVEPLT